MKTVLLSAYTCCPNQGSEPGNGWNWLMGYIRNGYTVHCVTSALYTQEIKTFCEVNKTDGLYFYFADSSLSASSLKIPFLGDYLHYYLWLIKARPQVKKLSKSVSFTHAHHVTYSSIKFGTPLYDLPIKVVLGPLGGGKLPHRSLKKYLGKSYYFESFKYAMGDFLSAVNPTVSSSIRTASCILVSNEIATGIIKKYSSLPLIKMFDAGLADHFETEYKKRELNGVVNILWIGTMAPRKGLNLAIDAIAALPESFQFHFYIVGDGSQRETSEKAVKALNLQAKTTFTGNLPYHLLRPVFEKSHLLLFPSLIDSCPMQVFECMAYGMPVVTLDHQGMKDQITADTGIKIQVDDGSDYAALLADGILSVSKNEDNYQKLSLNAYKFGQAQIWSKRIKNFTKDIIEKV